MELCGGTPTYDGTGRNDPGASFSFLCIDDGTDVAKADTPDDESIPRAFVTTCVTWLERRAEAVGRRRDCAEVARILLADSGALAAEDGAAATAVEEEDDDEKDDDVEADAGRVWVCDTRFDVPIDRSETLPADTGRSKFDFQVRTT